ncbi:hypothetical protein ACQCU1_15710 [Sutcliffiella horikoshii]|uniref:Uncharacterized protein n=1 Tax=Sutcliffiella horikoshii TaxID=79883 RepID=A0AA94WP06_9BACI|nr:hypothetical protein [Sutcliffiella horikoshii]TYS57523.1 hypothetical protein FZC74_15930 [Sutcliffiella horikoshii]
MEVAFVSVCATIIIFMAVFNLCRLFTDAYKKEEMNFNKFIVLISSSMGGGLLLSILFFGGYQWFWRFLSS